ncbi:class C beta-lactamase [Parasphingorhabdus cellanae]|uniref:Beta-lactamase n=1 Tax=Parasphingorhabdus cellanae TaxID=2806553 RepID=A0ABX7T736_9SPHN|nr:class C beta-lactamase [Parasphingorhabdus cellanae]QTD57316.1 beta-lactamase [Parasphingorhabdus cellanae]
MKQQKNHNLCLVLFTLIVGGCIRNDASEVQQLPITPIVENLVPSLMAEHEIQGMSVAISHNSQDYFYNFGVLDQESGKAVTQDTIFEVGSISKLFTVTLATKAELEGVISLDAPIGKYVDELTDSPLGEVPVFHLGTHTAGGFPLQLPKQVQTKKSLYEYYRAWRPEHPAGKQRHYANPSIGLLGLLVAQERKESFVSLMEQGLFPSIGMESTFIDVPDEALDNYAWGHSRKGEAVRLKPALLSNEAYGVKTTSADLLKFLKLNLSGTDHSNSLSNAAYQTQESYFETEYFQQSLVWEKYEYPIDTCNLKEGNSNKMILQPSPVTGVEAQKSNHYVLSKTGSTNGFGAYVFAVPSEDFALVLLANKYYPNGARVETAYRIAAEILSWNAEYCE